MMLMFDLLLCLGLAGVGLSLLFCRSHFDAIVLFIGLGLLLTLAWARLQAPDIALAEAAIGSGVSGVLLLEAFRSMRREPRANEPARASLKQPLLLVVALAASSLFVVLALGLLQLPESPVVLAEAVAANMASSGVQHPVTAVLLNFRGYDTLLEVAVVIIALIAVSAVRSSQQFSYPPPSLRLSRGVGAVVVPSLVLLAFYILWAGAVQPGGAFQAAALLAAALLLADFPARSALLHRLWLGLPMLVVTGFAVFLLVALLGVCWGTVLTLPVAYAGSLILAIELFLMLALGVVLALFVFALVSPPNPQQKPAQKRYSQGGES